MCASSITPQAQQEAIFVLKMQRNQLKCNLEPEVFIPFVAWSFRWKFHLDVNSWPTDTYVATNDLRPEVIWPYINGFPAPKANPYTPSRFDKAVTADECDEALASVLVDAVICALADYFIGNACSTMTQYIGHLRKYFRHPQNSSMVFGGASQLSMVQQYREMIENREVQQEFHHST